jgi:hypothetical protein
MSAIGAVPPADPHSGGRGSADPPRIAGVPDGPASLPGRGHQSQNQKQGQSPTGPTPGMDPVASSDIVSRLMCAATHLDASFADYVNGQLLKASYKAVCPSWGVDLVAVARHATLSRSRRLARDAALLRTLVGTGVALFVAALLGVIRVVSFYEAIGLVLLVVLAGVVRSWILVFRHYRAARHDALAMVDSSPPLRERAAPLSPSVEERLTQVNEGNVVIFSGPTPFVGSGLHLDNWTMTVDLSKGTVISGTDRRRTPSHFDSADVHDELLRAVPRGGLPGVQATNRLYVGGTTAPSLLSLIPPPVPRRQRPRSVVSEEELREIILQPREGARVYACFEKSGWGGQIIVSTFIRATRYENTLFIEGASYVLLPLGERFFDVYQLPLKRREELVAVALTAAGKAIPLLLGSAGRRLNRRKGAREEREALEAIEELRDRGRDVDFGATNSIRAQTADNERTYYASVDEVMYFVVLRRRVWNCLREFLISHDIDTSDLDRQLALVVDHAIPKVGAVNFGSGGSD